MIYDYQGHYDYDHDVINNWNSSDIGVYYCGFLATSGNLRPLYIGRAVGDEGIRGRLLDHLRDDYWPDVTHFGYHVCSSATEAVRWEAEEIAKFKPKYNSQGV